MHARSLSVGTRPVDGTSRQPTLAPAGPLPTAWTRPETVLRYSIPNDPDITAPLGFLPCDAPCATAGHRNSISQLNVACCPKLGRAHIAHSTCRGNRILPQRSVVGATANSFPRFRTGIKQQFGAPLPLGNGPAAHYTTIHSINRHVLPPSRRAPVAKKPRLLPNRYNVPAPTRPQVRHGNHRRSPDQVCGSSFAWLRARPLLPICHR